ncbi:hypothetical protein ACHAW6_004921 [Cyclotella cf. meneghiniana]
MARTFMVHVSLRWTERGVDDLSLWDFAVKHAAWIHNHILNRTQYLLLWNCLLRPRLIIGTGCVPMCGIVQYLFLILSCRMARKSLSGINNPALASLWDSLMSILL